MKKPKVMVLEEDTGFDNEWYIEMILLYPEEHTDKPIEYFKDKFWKFKQEQAGYTPKLKKPKSWFWINSEFANWLVSEFNFTICEYEF